MITTFLDCSKCYGRIEHQTAATRCVEDGCPRNIANLVFNMYGAKRRLRVHGVVSDEIVGNTGIIAGCAFAKDILKSFLRPLDKMAFRTKFRDYVDDMALTRKGGHPRRVALDLHAKAIRVWTLYTSEHSRQA